MKRPVTKNLVLERRSALKKLITGAALLASGAMPYGIARLMAPGHETPRRNYLRPPGALQNDVEFVKACIGCGLCGEVCPPKCIVFHGQSGGDAVNTPYINPVAKGCILCAKCTQVCPTEALTEIAVEKVNMGLAQIDRTACYPWVDRGVCGACVSICPLGSRAIRFKKWNQYQPIIEKGCVGCGLCVEVCPHPSTPIWIVDRSQGSIAKHKA